MDAEMKARELLTEEVARMEKTWEPCDYAEEYEKAALRAIARALSPPASAGEGFVCVPRVPTAAMIENSTGGVHFRTADCETLGDERELLRRQWAAMLAATPTPPAAAQEDARGAELFALIASEYLTVEPFDMPTGQGDADVGWRVYQYQGFDKKLLAEHFFDDLRAAIDAAMLTSPDSGKEGDRG